MMYAAFLRGINLGGRRAVAMADLRAFAEALGFTDARTLLNSGNLIFRSTRRSSEQLEKLFEAECEEHLGLHTIFHVRSAEELHAAIKDNPFPDEAKRDPARLVMFFLKTIPTQKTLVTPGPERVLSKGRHAFVYYPDGQGRSKLTPAMLDKAFGSGTARNWNTITKVAALISA